MGEGSRTHHDQMRSRTSDSKQNALRYEFFDIQDHVREREKVQILSLCRGIRVGKGKDGVRI